MATNWWRAQTALSIAGLAMLASSACGGYSAGNGNAPPANNFAYVAEANSLTGAFSVAQFQVSSDGTFTALNPPSLLIDPPDSSVTVDPSGKYLFADSPENSQTPGAIRQFVIGNDGTLTANAVPSINTISLPGALTFTPDGKFAIVPNSDNTVSSYALGPTGSLSLVNTVLAGFEPSSAVIDLTGRFAYVAAGVEGNSSEFTISEYAISASGALNLVVAYPLSFNPVDMVVSPRGFLYLTEYPPFGTMPGNIIEFSIDSANGGLSLIQNLTAADSEPRSIMFNPAGSYAYVINNDSVTISQYAVDTSSGVLAQNGPDVISSMGPMPGVVDPSGQFLFLPSQGQDNTSSPQIFEFIINADGTLTSNGAAAMLGDNTFPSVIAIAQH